MKSSTRNQSNFPALRSDARFDVLVKKERLEHESIIASHHKEMQALRDSLSLAMERFESLSNRNEQDLKDFKTYSVCTIGMLSQKVANSEGLISEQRKTIQDLHGQLLDFQNSYSSQADVDKFRKSVEGQIKDSTNSHINYFQDFQRESKILLNSLKEDLIKLRCDMEQKVSALADKGENNFSISRIDREGVLNEVRVYKMNMFIIDKKIENIYTLIERINKRGTSCHKPE